jgi:plastocyanin
MKRIWVAAFTSVFALAACGGAATAPTAAPQSTTAAAPTAAPATQAPAATSAPATSAPAAAPRKIEVTATNELYSIKTLEVKPGEKIEFVLKNTGDEKHNMVGVGEGVSIVSPDFDAGQTVSWIWTAPTKLGTFRLQCSYHAAIPPVLVTVK